MALIRVFTIPLPDGQYVFGGRPKTFMEVDWFRDDPQAGIVNTPTMTTEEGRKQIENFIKKKVYYKPDQAYLVLCSTASFTINYNVE